MELKQSDLWSECNQCGGKRTVKPPKHGDHFDEVCPACRGTGKKLTDKGKLLKEFVALVYDGDI